MLIIILIGSLPIVVSVALLIFTTKHNKENQISKDIIYKFEEVNNDNGKGTISELVNFHRNNKDTKSTNYRI